MCGSKVSVTVTSRVIPTEFKDAHTHLHTHARIHMHAHTHRIRAGVCLECGAALKQFRSVAPEVEEDQATSFGEIVEIISVEHGN